MSYTYRIIPEQNLLLITGTGVVTSADIYRVVTGFQEDPNWDPGMNMLVDWRRLGELLIELDDVRRLADDAVSPNKLENLTTPLGPRAAVVLSNQKYDAMPRLYAGFLRKANLETEIFYRMSEALDWLGVEAEGLSPAQQEALGVGR